MLHRGSDWNQSGRVTGSMSICVSLYLARLCLPARRDLMEHAKNQLSCHLRGYKKCVSYNVAVLCFSAFDVLNLPSGLIES